MPADDGNKVDRAVDATTEAAGDVADTIVDGAVAVKGNVASKVQEGHGITRTKAQEQVDKWTDAQ